MISTFWVAFLGVAYVLGLFAIAYAADRARARGRSPVDNPWVYSLSLAVYCTSWTFYGSVGRAAGQGLGFLPVYLGPTLVFLLAPTVLRRVVAHARAEGVTSVPDLLESLYGKGRLLGALATTMLVIGVTPYIGLQLKAVGYTFDLLTGRPPAATLWDDAALWAALGLGLFSVLFGARTLVTTERHEGMVAAVAFESAVKLGVFLVLGVYIVWGIGGGLGAVFTEALARPELSHHFVLGEGSGTPFAEWVSVSILSACAVILLPRQFHMLAVENVREEHLRPAAWIFPAYLLLINLLVLPVALVGLLAGEPGSPDFFLISMPLSRGRIDLAFLAFVGGFSAATGMVIVASVALATMILHHPGIGLLGQFSVSLGKYNQADFSRHLLLAKRLVIFGVVLLGYGFKRWIGDSHTLVNIGLLSFSAVTQFAPAVFLGLYWRGGTRAGALTGLVLGFAVWSYTLLLPSVAESGWVGAAILFEGPWGVELLRPQALFGLAGLDPWTHALVWSLVFNLGGYVTASLLSKARPRASELSPRQTWASREDLEALITRFVGTEKAREVFAGLPERASPQVLVETAERCLAGALGTPSARTVIESFLAWPRDQAGEILDVFGGVSRSLEEGRGSMERRLRELMVLHEASSTLSKSLHIDTVLAEVLHLIHREFGFEYLGVRLLDPDGMLRIRSNVGLEPDYVRISAVPPSEETYFGTCFLRGEPVVLEDARHVDKPVFFRHLTQNVPVTALIHAPMVHEGRSIGVLTGYATRGPMHFTEEFVSLFAALANQLALAVANARLYAEVSDYSHAMEEKVRHRTAELEAANARLRELDRLKSDFLSTVSHELRTPLTSIRSFSEILLRYDVDKPEQRRKFIAIIQAEAERLSRMINELLDLSKIEAGRIELNPEPVGVEQAIRKALDVARPLLAEKGVLGRQDVERGLPLVHADSDRLQQVLANLLSNAAKFAPAESEVRVSARRRGDFAVLSVSDRGAGIPAARLNEVFERYRQVRDPEKAHPLGTGLGLSISKEIVQRLGGQIWVESEPGEGTTFFFTLPLVPASTASHPDGTPGTPSA
ncbi:MAG: ATP-binding protein [Deferrisomatales bacterium]|nr:ATP-binding protein [Deferrisomatales bacterium]